VKSNHCTRRVNLGRLHPVRDPFRSSDMSDLEEQSPPCPVCNGETLWFWDSGAQVPELICIECTPFNPANDEPDGDGPPCPRCRHAETQRLGAESPPPSTFSCRECMYLFVWPGPPRRDG
jgi:hypothetical protein